MQNYNGNEIEGKWIEVASCACVRLLAENGPAQTSKKGETIRCTIYLFVAFESILHTHSFKSSAVDYAYCRKTIAQS